MSKATASKREKESHERLMKALGEVFAEPVKRLGSISESEWNEAGSAK